MPDHIFREKRIRRRAGSFLTLRMILGLLVLSGVLAGVFYLEFGDVSDSVCEGACESMHSIGIWVLAGTITFVSIILIAAFIGTVFAAIKRKRNSTLDSLISANTSENKE